MRVRLPFKRRIGKLYALMHARDAQRKLILMYHSVGQSPLATAKETFREHIRVIAMTGHLLPLRDLLVSTPSRSIAIAITFDDGYAGLKDHASAILAELGSAATAFLSVSEIADEERRSSRPEDRYYPGEQFLTWRDVDALLSAGWQIGSHGVHHLDLVSADTATIKYELSASKRIIEQRLGTTCDMFSYPWGRSNPRVRAEVRSAGYRYGFAAYHSRLTAKSDPLALPRINVSKEYSRDDIIAILRGDWDYLHWIAKAKAVMELTSRRVSDEL
jgi:peptidoglycan/xylan/chitin deacetylase (PgdA/CDA1 family)